MPGSTNIVYNNNSIRFVKNKDKSFSAGYAYKEQYPVKGITLKTIKKHSDWRVNFPAEATIYSNYREVLDDEGNIKKIIITYSDGTEKGYLRTNNYGTYMRGNESIVRATICGGCGVLREGYDEYTLGFVPEKDVRNFNPYSYDELDSYGEVLERAKQEFPDVDPKVVGWIVDLAYTYASKSAFDAGCLYGDSDD